MNRPYGPDPRVTRAKSIGREKVLSRAASRFPQNEAGPAGARQGAPTRKPTNRDFQEAAPAQSMKTQAPMVFARVALGSGPRNAEHFSWALAYLGQSEEGQADHSY